MCTVGVCLLSVVDRPFLQFLYIPEWLFAVTWDPPVPLYPPESSCGTSEGKRWDLRTHFEPDLVSATPAVCFQGCWPTEGL